MGNGIGETRAPVDLRDESPHSLQAGFRLVTRPITLDYDGQPMDWHEFILQALAFVGPGQGYRWVDIETIHQHRDGTECTGPDDHE
jgi:hypothetical protein